MPSPPAYAGLISALPRVLSTFSRREVPVGSRRRAAVLVPLVFRSHSLHVLFTLRSPTLPTHAGQVSFPGGHIEAGEDARTAALREAGEELGASLPWTVFGALHEVLAVTGTHVVPLLALCEAPLDNLDEALHPPPAEVARVFSLPLAALCAPGAAVWRRVAEPGAAHPRAGLMLPVFAGGPAPIWGLSAFILQEMLESVMRPAAAAGGGAAAEELRALLDAPRPPRDGGEDAPMGGEARRSQDFDAAGAAKHVH